MALEEFELFAGMKPSDLALLKTVAREEIYQKDDRIIETGAPGRGLFLIAQGQVKISLRLANGQTHHVTTLGRGQIFGEMSFLDDARYSADGHASEHTELIVIEKQQFMQTVEQHPAIFATMLQRIGLGLAARLRHTNDELRNLVEA
jgi:CRP-like cAMP-binding protein